MAIRIVLAHSFDIIVQGLRAEMAAFPALSLQDVVHTGDELRAALERGCDAVVTGLYMPGFNGIESVRGLCRDFPSLRVAILTAYPQYSRQAKKLEIPGYILKSESAPRIAHAIYIVASGGSYYSADVEGADQLRPMPKPDILSARELEVLRLVARGSRNAEIAQHLGITTRTVEFHKQNIKERLQLETSADLIRYAYEHDLLPASGLP